MKDKWKKQLYYAVCFDQDSELIFLSSSVKSEPLRYYGLKEKSDIIYK